MLLDYNIHFLKDFFVQKTSEDCDLILQKCAPTAILNPVLFSMSVIID